jgi:hypothetical protein
VGGAYPTIIRLVIPSRNQARKSIFIFVVVKTTAGNLGLLFLLVSHLNSMEAASTWSHMVHLLLMSTGACGGWDRFGYSHSAVDQPRGY